MADSETEIVVAPAGPLFRDQVSCGCLRRREPTEVAIEAFSAKWGKSREKTQNYSSPLIFELSNGERSSRATSRSIFAEEFLGCTFYRAFATHPISLKGRTIHTSSSSSSLRQRAEEGRQNWRGKLRKMRK